MGKRRQDVMNHRAEILELAARYGARNVRLFGSVARDEDTPDSDIDFLVDLDPGRGLLDLGGLLMDLRDTLRAPVDVATPALLKERIRSRIVDEAIPL